MKLWKRNAVVAAIILFVCAAVYLNWSYSQEGMEGSTDTGKVLGEAALVDGKTEDPLLAETKPVPTDAGEEGKPSEKPSGGYFDSARLNRQQARDSALSLLQEAASDEAADQASIDQANEAIQSMAAFTLSEANIENLVTAKGYADCVAFLSEDSISVVVSNNAQPLSQTDTAKISEIVMDETGFHAGQIKIIEAS
ncbi:SpoIIIAH-like family protein [Intestinimonas sp.]|uniref:SpoIIIAH-like family protein n=1 Tax=Intestinimonas sp. TaxID=1965293 RepID=UPI00262DD1BE|nr:SpoIIIAH-like family protein [Intestinimonas sp.]